MKVLEPIRWDTAEKKLYVLNQLRLPTTIEYLKKNTIEDVFYAIKHMELRGAPLIGIAAAYGIVLGLKNLKSNENLFDNVKENAEFLAKARPTAFNLFWALNHMQKCAMEIEERPNEPFLCFAADKTDPGAYNLPLYLTFTDPMFNPGLMLSPACGEGFKFNIMDVANTEGDRMIELLAPENLYDIATLLRDNERFVIESIYSRSSGKIAAAVSTTRLHNIAGKYTGKDDPVCLVRVQGNFPATGEVLSPYSIGHYVAGFMRGSHIGPLMPVKINSPISYFDGPPVVTCHAFCVHERKFTESVDVFDHPFWDYIRTKVSRKAVEIREQGFFGAAMLPYSELEYGGIVEKMEKLDKLFKIRE